MAKLYYDKFGHVFALQSEQGNFSIATDFAGTPTEVFALKSGRFIKRITRSPFGLLLDDSQPETWIPLGTKILLLFIHRVLLHYFLCLLGFHGGIEVEQTGTVLMGPGNTKPFDSHIVQWMSPQLDFLLDPGFNDVTKIHSYR